MNYYKICENIKLKILNMLSRFIAIGVNQGDAFFLQRNDFTILVDGGRSSSKFIQLFQEVTNYIGVNVLVCT